VPIANFSRMYIPMSSVMFIRSCREKVSSENVANAIPFACLGEA